MFNETLEPASATNTANYVLDQGITVVGAFLEADGQTVALSTTALTGGNTYTLDIDQVADASGNAMALVSIPFEYADILVPNGLVAYWPMEEGTGATTEDLSDNNHDGSLQSATWSSNGRFGNALRFDGANGTHVDVGSFSVSGTELTVCGWFNADDFGTGDARIVSKAVDQQVADHWFMLSTVTSGSDGFLRARLKTSGTTDTLIASNGAFRPGD